MIYGFTGTQRGMRDIQHKLCSEFLKPEDTLHHGDCVGSDEQMHNIAVNAGCKIVIHPPSNPKKRAYCGASATYDFVLLPEKDYIPRNHDIVDACEHLIATPFLEYEEQRSGTWATVRYAWRIGRYTTIIYPSGMIQAYNLPTLRV